MNDQAALQLLEELVRTPSVSHHEQAVAELLVDWMQRYGFDAHIDPVGNAIGTLGTGEQAIILLGHIDTVGGVIPVEIRDGELWGRGSVDAKGCMATFVVAAARAAQRADLPYRIVIAGCVEEEVASSRGAVHLAETWPSPLWCIVGEPSGAERVTLGYKGNLRATFRLQQAATHSAHQTATIAERACLLWNEIALHAETYNRAYPRAFEHILPRLIALNTSHDGLQESATLEINVRLPLACNPDAYTQQLQTYLKDEQMQLTVAGATPAYTSERTTPLARQFIRAMRKHNLQPRFVQKTGTADMNIVGPAWGCPVVAYGPGDAALDHTPEERLNLAEYLQAIQILTDVLQPE